MDEGILAILREVLSLLSDLGEVVVVVLAIYDRIKEKRNDRQGPAKN